MEALERIFANVCSFLIVTIVLISLAVMRHANFRDRNPLFWENMTVSVRSRRWYRLYDGALNG